MHQGLKLALVGLVATSTTGCLAAGLAIPAAIGTGVTAAGYAAHKGLSAAVNFGDITFRKSLDSPSSIEIEGTVSYRPARSGTREEFYHLTPSSNRFEAVLLGEGDKRLTAVTGAITVWDEGEEVGAIPADKPLRFKMSPSVPANVVEEIRAVRVSGIPGVSG